MNIGKFFKLEDFLHSQTAARMGRVIEVTPQQIANVSTLCALVLDPLRQHLGRAITITSGIRPDWLNVAVGGAVGSAHTTGRAADIKAIGMTPTVLARWIKTNGSYPVDKCILEFPESSSGGWVHVQIADGANKPRQQYLVARKNGKQTIYGEMI